MPVLSPFQRRLDEGVWTAFQTKDLGPLFAALAASSNASADVNYRRAAADLTTPLMAAAFVGDEPAAVELVRRGALAHLQDRAGRTAADFAALGGHAMLAATLRAVTQGEREYLEGLVLGLAGGSAAPKARRPVAAASGPAQTASGGPAAAEEDEEDDEEEGVAYDYYVAEDDAKEPKGRTLKKSAATTAAAAAGTSNAGAGAGTSGAVDADADEELDSDEEDDEAPAPLSRITVFVDPISFAIAQAAAEQEGVSTWDYLEIEAGWGDERDGDGAESHDSEDSNAEDAEGNEYPEDGEGDEGDDDRAGDDDDEEEDKDFFSGDMFRRKMKW